MTEEQRIRRITQLLRLAVARQTLALVEERLGLKRPR